MDSMINIIKEGKVKFYASRDATGKISKELEVFYNPLMKTNRDVTIAVLNAIDQKDMQVCDLMAGSGVRSLRLLKELNSGIIKSLVVNDYDADFQELFNKNLELNKIPLDDKIIIKAMDANKLLLESKGFDYVDIDPFGSPNDFLENSIIRLSRKGIFAVTATDTAPLAGTFPDACLRKYWAKPLRNHLMHETGLRILIRKIQLVGVQHDKALIPIFSYYKNHYFRIMFKCVKSKKKCDELLKQHNYLLFDDMNVIVSKFISNVANNNTINYAGPLWTGRLWDEDLLKRIEQHILTDDFVDTEFIRIILEESKINNVGFYDLHKLSQKYKFQVPNFELVMQKIISKGYKASRTHFSGYGIKTDMKIRELLDILIA